VLLTVLSTGYAPKGLARRRSAVQPALDLDGVSLRSTSPPMSPMALACGRYGDRARWRWTPGVAAARFVEDALKSEKGFSRGR